MSGNDATQEKKPMRRVHGPPAGGVALFGPNVAVFSEMQGRLRKSFVPPDEEDEAVTTSPEKHPSSAVSPSISTDSPTSSTSVSPRENSVLTVSSTSWGASKRNRVSKPSKRPPTYATATLDERPSPSLQEDGKLAHFFTSPGQSAQLGERGREVRNKVLDEGPMELGEEPEIEKVEWDKTEKPTYLAEKKVVENEVSEPGVAGKMEEEVKTERTRQLSKTRSPFASADKEEKASKELQKPEESERHKPGSEIASPGVGSQQQNQKELNPMLDTEEFQKSTSKEENTEAGDGEAMEKSLAKASVSSNEEEKEVIPKTEQVVENDEDESKTAKPAKTHDICDEKSKSKIIEGSDAPEGPPSTETD